jgi:hypothetical protein
MVVPAEPITHLFKKSKNLCLAIPIIHFDVESDNQVYAKGIAAAEIISITKSEVFKLKDLIFKTSGR